MLSNEETILISVHIPKTGGTSFSSILRDLYGAGYLEDYEWIDDRPDWMINGLDRLSDKEIMDSIQGVRCIHGHFLAEKYARLQYISGLSVRFATWLRDPIDRAVSMYYFLRRLNTPDEEQADWERTAKELDLYNYFLRTPYGWSGQSDQLRNFDVKRFDFIGIMERYQESIQLFLSLFASPETRVKIPHELQNQQRKTDHYEVDGKVRQRLLELNYQDYYLYHEGLNIFENAMMCLKGRSPV